MTKEEVMSEIIGNISVALFIVGTIAFYFSIIKKEKEKAIKDQKESNWLQNIFALAKNSKVVEFVILKNYENAYFRIITLNTSTKCGNGFYAHEKSWCIALKEAFKKQGLIVHEVRIYDEDAFFLRRLHF
jgi:GT2 family glycosyltransferase